MRYFSPFKNISEEQIHSRTCQMVWKVLSTPRKTFLAESIPNGLSSWGLKFVHPSARISGRYPTDVWHQISAFSPHPSAMSFSKVNNVLKYYHILEIFFILTNAHSLVNFFRSFSEGQL